MSNEQIFLAALQEEIRRREIRKSLTRWCEHVLSPFGQMPARHHLYMLDALERVAKGEIDRLLLQLPPGSAKSTYASVLMPAWLLAQQPGMKIIGASHTSELSERFSSQVRRLIEEHSRVLGYSLREDSRSKELWETTNGGEYKAGSVGGSITGYRADCLVGNTRIATVDGDVNIENLEVGTYIRSYDIQNNKVVYRPVTAIARRNTDIIWRIRTTAGRVVEATGNHRIFTARGWCAAASLDLGDVLLSSMWSGVEATTSRHSQGGRSQHGGGVLQQDVLHAIYQRGAWNGGHSHLQSLSQSSHEAKQPVLFGGMQDAKSSHKGSRETDGSGAPLRGLRDTHSSPRPIRGPAASVQPEMWRHSSRSANAGGEQSGISARIGEHLRVAAGLVGCEAADMGAGRDAVRRLFERHGPASSPHQPESARSSFGKSGDTLSQVPHEAARGGPSDTEPDTVAMAERLCRSEVVYDIQVAGTECFFANGVLVHNCAIIDDPVKSREHAESVIEKQKVWNWYTSDLITRLKPGGRIVLVMTRWSEDDLAGRILETDGPQRWTVIRLPALAEADDPLGRAIGEPLWPSWEPLSALEDKRATIGERDFQSLFQQNPRPPGGGLFHTSKIKSIPHAPPGHTHMVRAWDLSATAGGDWTVGVLLAKYASGQFVVADVARMRGDPSEVEKFIVATAAEDGAKVPINLPQDPGSAGVMVVKYLTTGLQGYDVTSSRESGDKESRARPVISQTNVGNLSLVTQTHASLFLDELAAFPGGRYDDCVDALSRAFNALVQPAKPARAMNIPFMAR